MQQQRIVDNTAAEEGLNDFMAAKQAALFDAPDGFYHTQGSDAADAAPSTLDKLNRMKDQALDGMDNDAQRNKLGQAIDTHLTLAGQDIDRHVAEQNLAWQRQTAQGRIDALMREASLHHNDDELVDEMSNAAANAARAHLRVGGAPVDIDTEDAAATKAKSGIYHMAILGHLDRGNNEDAATMLDRLSDQLDPEHAAELGSQLATAKRLDVAKAYAAGLVPQWSTSHDEADAQHAAATEQNQSENQVDPAYQADVQHVLDVQHAIQNGYIAFDVPGDFGRGDKRLIIEKITGNLYYSNTHHQSFYPMKLNPPAAVKT